MERLADESDRPRAHAASSSPTTPRRSSSRIRRYVDLGFDELVLHAPGDDQARFLDQFAGDVLPLLRDRLPACMLKDRVMFMSGGSRGIGLAIAARAARDGAKVALIAKTAEPHPQAAGDDLHRRRGDRGGRRRGAADRRRHPRRRARSTPPWRRRSSASAASTSSSTTPARSTSPRSRDLEVKRFDLMQQINARGTFVVTRACLPHLRESDHAHVLTLSPPLSVDPRWLGGHSAYTLSKMGMTMITLGVAADEAEAGDRPPTACGRARSSPRPRCRTCSAATRRWRAPACREIVADAAYEILDRDPRECTGNTFIDDEVLAEAGITDLDRYAGNPDAELVTDIFVEESPVSEPSAG